MVGGGGSRASVLAFLVGGAIATFLTWRVTFGLFVVHAAAVLLLSVRLMRTEPKPDVKIDAIGTALSATAIVLIAFACNNILAWGVFLAGPGAPFELLGVSPVPIIVILGIMIGGIFVWTHHRAASGKAPTAGAASGRLTTPMGRSHCRGRDWWYRIGDELCRASLHSDHTGPLRS